MNLLRALIDTVRRHSQDFYGETTILSSNQIFFVFCLSASTVAQHAPPGPIANQDTAIVTATEPHNYELQILAKYLSSSSTISNDERIHGNL